MQRRVASFTPLPVAWPHPLGVITQRVSVIDRPTFDEDDWQRMFNLRGSDVRAILQTTHWLSVESDGEQYGARKRLPKSATELRNAMLAFQLWAPKGWTGIIINADSTDAGSLKVDSVQCPEPYVKTEWGNFLSLKHLPVAELGKLIDGVCAAMEADSAESHNPFQYLEIGLQTAFDHFKAGALLWMIGLDSLLTAQSEALFASRLCRLLGADTRIFPDDSVGRRPVYTVAAVAADIYQMRNQIAHGDRIHDAYLEKTEFRFDHPDAEYLRIGERTYQSVFLEAALFALVAALRKVILDGHLERLRQPRAWKNYLGGKNNSWTPHLPRLVTRSPGSNPKRAGVTPTVALAPA
jgi:hypothetical protein